MVLMKENEMCMMLSIKQSTYQLNDQVDFIIFAGDIFENPKPNGNAILQMANALKRLKENDILTHFLF